MAEGSSSRLPTSETVAGGDTSEPPFSVGPKAAANQPQFRAGSPYSILNCGSKADKYRLHCTNVAVSPSVSISNPDSEPVYCYQTRVHAGERPGALAEDISKGFEALSRPGDVLPSVIEILSASSREIWWDWEDSNLKKYLKDGLPKKYEHDYLSWVLPATSRVHVKLNLARCGAVSVGIGRLSRSRMFWHWYWPEGKHWEECMQGKSENTHSTYSIKPAAMGASGPGYEKGWGKEWRESLKDQQLCRDVKSVSTQAIVDEMTSHRKLSQADITAVLMALWMGSWAVRLGPSGRSGSNFVIAEGVPVPPEVQRGAGGARLCMFPKSGGVPQGLVPNVKLVLPKYTFVASIRNAMVSFDGVPAEGLVILIPITKCGMMVVGDITIDEDRTPLVDPVDLSGAKVCRVGKFGVAYFHEWVGERATVTMSRKLGCTAVELYTYTLMESLLLT